MLTRIRPSDVLVTSDIGQTLAALQMVAAAYPAGTYRDGFLAGLAAVSTALGVRLDVSVDLATVANLAGHTDPATT